MPVTGTISGCATTSRAYLNSCIQPSVHTRHDGHRHIQNTNIAKSNKPSDGSHDTEGAKHCWGGGGGGWGWWKMTAVALHQCISSAPCVSALRQKSSMVPGHNNYPKSQGRLPNRVAHDCELSTRILGCFVYDRCHGATRDVCDSVHNTRRGVPTTHYPSTQGSSAGGPMHDPACPRSQFV